MGYASRGRSDHRSGRFLSASDKGASRFTNSSAEASGGAGALGMRPTKRSPGGEASASPPAEGADRGGAMPPPRKPRSRGAAALASPPAESSRCAAAMASPTTLTSRGSAAAPSRPPEGSDSGEAVTSPLPSARAVRRPSPAACRASRLEAGWRDVPSGGALERRRDPPRCWGVTVKRWGVAGRWSGWGQESRAGHPRSVTQRARPNVAVGQRSGGRSRTGCPAAPPEGDGAPRRPRPPGSPSADMVELTGIEPVASRVRF